MDLKIIEGVLNFRENVYPERKDLFGTLATGQSPHVLFITCSDSRIDPNLVTCADPGDLFICRNAGNIIPPHSNETGGMTASVEYAVAVLGVDDIVICGHTDCGAVKGALNVDQLKGLPHVKEWLSHCRSAMEIVRERNGIDSEACIGHEHLDEAIEENVLQQLQHLRTHPAVAAKLATGKVRLHGWVYDIEKGEIRCSDGGAFVDFRDQYAEEIEAVNEKRFFTE
ncbi:carbonic anhydrase [Bacterioplanoides sp. SCSIO 12839]|uniref:carbonic anhydrase n=1 Tax=Bacterioplanoides sp. SCSIO 12839 TaxID=2829569 RepID=UPI002108538A|nr:carbonic anhydrase [Bacterioplanoides sp. SCSIO 12839]UTW48689.1 carbonic anhydrase [Bacterioplanoides sp. SCSIO 12839]